MDLEQMDIQEKIDAGLMDIETCWQIKRRFDLVQKALEIDLKRCKAEARALDNSPETQKLIIEAVAFFDELPAQYVTAGEKRRLRITAQNAVRTRLFGVLSLGIISRAIAALNAFYNRDVFA